MTKAARRAIGECAAGALALHLAISGVVGAVNMGSTTIYTLEHWGLLRCTATHFLITMAWLCLIGFSMGWFDLREPLSLLILAACVVIYFIIWMIMYLRCKRQIRQINEALRAWKDQQGA